jgi:hypothetical protein
MARLTLERIKARCEEDGDCLIWQGKVYPKNGHPAATEWIDGKDCHVGVRRRAYEEYHKVKLTADQYVATCGNPACLAKEHLHLITIAERSRRMHRDMDAARKLRYSRTLAQKAQAAKGKLTPEQVRAVIDSPDGPYVTAKRLGINGVVASRIRRGISYREYAATPFAGMGAR